MVKSQHNNIMHDKTCFQNTSLLQKLLNVRTDFFLNYIGSNLFKCGRKMGNVCLQYRNDPP
jgi:hypothetical protein